MRKKSDTLEKPKQKTVGGNWKTQLGYYLMFAVPAIWVFINSYLPMIGIYMAFTDFKPAKGLFGSKFIGLENFRRFFASADFGRVIRNTVFYNLAVVVIINLIVGMTMAILLYEIRSRRVNKIYHTCMLFPSFLAWTVISATLMTVLHPDSGILNMLLESLGMEKVRWYSEPSYWPAIILICEFIKNGGMASIYFYSALLSIDIELFDAANLDGANRIQQILHISLPAMSKVFCITLISTLGSVLSSSVSPFFELTLNNGELFETTQVLGTYLYNGLGGGKFSFMTAVGLFQSLIGLVLVLASNAIIKRVDPESAMF